MTENEIGKIIVDAAIAVHRELGLVYWKPFMRLFLLTSYRGEDSMLIGKFLFPIEYDGIRFDEGFRADLIVENKVILELKSVEKVIAAHKKQIQTYLRLADHKLGYLLNFGEALMKHGITKAVNNLEE